jgi:hypothetical protein
MVLPDKVQSSYEVVLEKLKQLILEQHKKILVVDIMCDFEAALQKALAIKFPDAKVKGCWLHFN